MTASRLGMIWAQARDGAIGVDGVMPWHVPEDMAHFKAVTMGHPVIMGRRTWESIPPRFRPLEGRRNIVVTSDPDWVDAGAEVARDPEAALALARDPQSALARDPAAAPARARDAASGAETWVIGGGSIYAALVDHADVLEVTEVAGEYAADTFAPPIDARWRLESQTPWATSRSGPAYRFLRYRSH